MKHNLFLLFLLTVLFASCDSQNEEKIVLRDASLEAYEALEKDMNAESVTVAGYESLSKAFLPIDTSLKFFKKLAYNRVEPNALYLTSRAFEDSLGNLILLYEWDKITSSMSQSEKEKLKREFDKHHEDYVGKYNQLTDQLTEVFGPPMNADKKLQVSDLQVYKLYKSTQIWKNDKQIIELDLVLAPNELYKVIVKNMVLKQ